MTKDNHQFGPIKISNVVVEGQANQSFEINEFYEMIEPTERVIYIIAPRIKGQDYRIKRWNNISLEKKKISNKGRPLLDKPKKKYQDSVKTAIMFFLLSNDPNQEEGHFYNIKFYTGGLINITGITELDQETKAFNPYLNETIETFKMYLSKIFDKKITIEFNLTKFAGINFKSSLLSKARIDRDKMYKILNNKILSYRYTDKDRLRKFIKLYVESSFKLNKDELCDYLDENLNLLDTYQINDIKVKDSYLLSLLNYDLSNLQKLREYSSQSFYKILKKDIIDNILVDILVKLYNHKSNIIQSLSPKNTSKRGLGIKFILGTEGITPIIRCVNVFKNSSYNSSCKGFEDGIQINQILNNYFKKYDKSFLISEEIYFKIAY